MSILNVSNENSPLTICFADDNDSSFRNRLLRRAKRAEFGYPDISSASPLAPRLLRPIGNVGLGDQKEEGIYNVNGVKTDRLTKGVNVIRMADGTVRKVIVK